MTEQRDQIRPATTAKVCLDLAKSGRFTVPVLSTAGFNRPLLALSTICRCPSRSKERSWPRNRGNLGNVGLDQIRMRENYPEYAGYIHDAGTILLDIINGILDLARIEAGRVLLQEELITLGGLIQSSVNTIKPIAQRKSIEIDCEIEQPSTMIYVDPTKFKQVTLNLLSNSVKFTEPRGRIQVNSVLQKSGDLVLSIKDTGIGIPAEQIEKIFQPFEQVADHLTREHEGTGLGLPIAKALIELHGGELVLSSQLGAGTTARLRLPGDQSEALQPPPQRNTPRRFPQLNGQSHSR